MAVAGIKRTRIVVSLPEATYESVKILALRRDVTVSRYIKSLVDQEVLKTIFPFTAHRLI